MDFGLYYTDVQTVDPRTKGLKMRIKLILLMPLTALALSACAQPEEDVAIAAPPPLPQGAVAGSMAADRDGDGIIDGYYNSDGIYYANQPPLPPPPPPRVTRRGERG